MKFRWRNNRNVYMDYAASTPIEKDVLRAMKEMALQFANPSAIHKMGVSVREKINEARKNIAKHLGAHEDEIVFTGSATESIALSIMGVVYGYNGEGVPHIISSRIEHKAVLSNFELLEKRNLAKVTLIDVDENGILDMKSLKESISPETILVSIGYANNEIGVIQDIEEIARILRRLKKQDFFKNKNFPYFHTDATQAMNYLFAKNMDKLGVDLLSFNGAKIYGPKGIGVLYKRRGVNLQPFYKGGDQEYGLRSGTENVATIVGISKALEITEDKKEEEAKRLKNLQTIFIEKIREVSECTGFSILINGDLENRLPNNVNISIDGISNELVLIELDAKGVYVSTKSACSAEEDGASHVILSIRGKSELQKNALDQRNNTDKILNRVGAPEERVKRAKFYQYYEASQDSLRFSFGRGTTEKDIYYTISILEKILLKYKNVL